MDSLNGYLCLILLQSQASVISHVSHWWKPLINSGTAVYCLNRLGRKLSSGSLDTGAIHIHILFCHLNIVLWENMLTFLFTGVLSICVLSIKAKLHIFIFSANNTPRLATWLFWMEIGFNWQGIETLDSLVSSLANVVSLDRFCSA